VVADGAEVKSEDNVVPSVYVVSKERVGIVKEEEVIADEVSVVEELLEKVVAPVEDDSVVEPRLAVEAGEDAVVELAEASDSVVDTVDELGLKLVREEEVSVAESVVPGPSDVNETPKEEDEDEVIELADVDEALEELDPKVDEGDDSVDEDIELEDAEVGISAVLELWLVKVKD